MIVEPAPAKINLALHVRHRRPDGYHELETLFAFAQDGDEIRLEPAAATNRFDIAGPFADSLIATAPDDDRWAGNLVTRAADAFADAFGIHAAHAITLDKHLPVASGIGGGSADAAATLRALARLHAIDAQEPRLVDIAARLGADVPACLLGRTAIGTGKGDALVPIDGLAGTPLLLVNPGVAVSTAQVFKAWDGVDRGGIADGSLLDRALAGRNDLEGPAIAIAPVIATVLALLGGAGDVRLARMSGSGATCFALFGSVAARAAAAQTARAHGYWCLETALC